MNEQTMSGPVNLHRPPEHRTVIVVAGRVVEVETLHVGKSVWVATGRVSEPLPSGPFLKSSLELTATGHSAETAVHALRRRIEQLSPRRGG